ncbi:hypothetical protein BTN98_14165 [Photobacterium aquimaris]|uniref:Uncharacterized protein n=2 Tax=Photobacterium aquimaris TaxID=512643 RepID=A0A2T3HW55_9GAMM|nr:hypothetical protein AYY21_05615 [Photobacterium aquimaris]PQJ38549.1 hypothetical protein BTN98_14165 [Photobacterium aquimaris]PSU03023.1 hypothetical protein C0W81_13325 [Photobacterium aquimaris]
MHNLTSKRIVNISLIVTVFFSMCAQLSYAQNMISTPTVISVTQAYINHQTKMRQPQQNIIYHPTLGYMEYQQIWCNNDQQQAITNYQRFIADICLKRGGKLTNNWCVISKIRQPLFYTDVSDYDANCTTNHATIVQIIEVLPMINKDPIIAKAWLQTAQSLGY